MSIDENMREAGLKELRERNFQILIDQLAGCGLSPGASVLDVGCAHGWFLRALSARGYTALGIEPDLRMAAIARMAGQNVCEGFFPDDLPPGQQYDAITFNDVFEHLPRVADLARHCMERLKPGGLLLINSPNTGGAFYRIAKLVRRAGMRSLWNRMWQRFVIAEEQAKGSWERIRYTGMALPAAAVIWSGLLIARPIIRMLPADYVVFMFRK